MRKSELAGLTGIRFYAALFVYLSHIPIIPGMEKLAGSWVLFNAGVVGVSFFFVLSGFILTYNYAEVFRNGVSTASYKRFVWDRFAKIYPVHLAALILVLPIAIMSPNLPLDWRALPFHALMAQCWWPLTSPVFYDYLNVPSWSISCEWFFYLVAPALIFFAVGKTRRWIPIAIMAAYVGGLGFFLWRSGSDWARLYLVSWFAPSRVVEFMVGVFLGAAFLRASASGQARTRGVGLQVLGAIVLVTGAIYRAHAPWPLWGGLLYVPGSTLLVYGLACGEGAVARHLSRPWLNRLGLASFPLYMIHAPLIRAMKGVWLHFGWEVHSWVQFAMVVVGMFVLVQSAALLMHYLYEMPMQRMLRGWMKPQPKAVVAGGIA